MTNRKTATLQSKGNYDKGNRPKWFSINGRLKVSRAAQDLYDEDIMRTPQIIQQIMKREIGDTGGVEIKYNAVQMAVMRHKKNLIEPRLKAAMKRVDPDSDDVDTTDLESGGIEISSIFKDVIKYKRFAEGEGVKMSIGEITTLLDKSNQLKKNEYEFVTKDKLVDATCDLILQFRLSCDYDPDINDPMNSFLEDEE